jgi:hypothetical protein
MQNTKYKNAKYRSARTVTVRYVFTMMMLWNRANIMPQVECTCLPFNPNSRYGRPPTPDHDSYCCVYVALSESKHERRHRSVFSYTLAIINMATDSFDITRILSLRRCCWYEHVFGDFVRSKATETLGDCKAGIPFLVVRRF